MRCPFCQDPESRVTDSREAHEGAVIRRRRECQACKRRFTSFERVEELAPLIVKKDGRREAYDRVKLKVGLERACDKRPVPAEQLERVILEVEKHLQDFGEREVQSSLVGEEVMRRLRGLDEVAYVRFASVYRQFKDLGEFMAELEGLLAQRSAPGKDQRPV